jgi:hypothetical protein
MGDWLGAPVSTAMLRALNDLRKGPAFSQPSTLFHAEQPARMFIRRRTIKSLEGRRFVEVERIADYIDKVSITETGRAFLLRHPLYRELQAA